MRKMMEYKQFSRLLNSAEILHNYLDKWAALNSCNTDTHPIGQSLDIILEELIDNTELEIDDSIGPVVYDYCFCRDWGKTVATYELSGISYKVYNDYSLYIYLKDKWEFDEKRMSINEDKD